MPAIQVGRICFRTRGKNAGEKVVVIEVPAAPKGFAVVEGTHSKKGKCNILHLWPTPHSISLPNTYTKKDIRTAIQGTGI